MFETIAHVRENRDNYPFTNLRWTHALGLFILPPTLYGYLDGGVEMAVLGFALGAGITTFISLLWYGGERHKESRIARATLAGVLTLVIGCIVALLGILGWVVVTALSPPVAFAVLVGGSCLAVFVGLFYALS